MRATRLLIPILAAVAAFPACRPEAERIAGRAPSSQTFRAAVDAVLPAVVYIQVEARPVQFGGIFPQFPGMPEGHPDPGPSTGAGSGVLFSPDGYILTSDHVVQQADRVTVTLHDRRQFDARVVARDPSTDVAVVKIDGEDLPAAQLGDSDQLALGDWVLALGSPLGLQFSVTAGVVSAIGRAIGILDSSTEGEPRTAPLEHFIQTDAAINPGNSGGPLVNLAGQVVGINTAIASPTGFYAGYGFAVPINLARRVARQLIEHGHVRRAYLGVLLSDVDPADAAVYGLESTQGAEVVSVEEESPAAEAGLRVGDVIVGVAGREVATMSDVQATLAGLEPGTTAQLSVFRYGERLEVPVELGLVRSGIRPEAPAPLEEPTRVGFAVVPRDDGRLAVAAVRPYSPAARAGVRPGQVILQLNREEIRSVEEFAAEIRDLEEPVVSLLVVDPQLGRIIINYRLKP